jgi:hypothetical protein
MNCLPNQRSEGANQKHPREPVLPERFNCGKGRAYSEPAGLRDQFTGRKRPKA